MTASSVCSISASALGVGPGHPTVCAKAKQAVPGLSFLARTDKVALAGVISYWRVFIGERAMPALLLGPLAVHPNLQGQGIGRALMQHTLARARARGERLVILVGDEPYYARVGFRKVPEGRLVMPGHVDPDRLLYLDLVEGALDDAAGLVLSPSRLHAETGSLNDPRGTTSGLSTRAAGQARSASRTAGTVQFL